MLIICEGIMHFEGLVVTENREVYLRFL